MQIKEEKICSFTQKGKRIQLLDIHIATKESYYHSETNTYDYWIHKYEIRINRKIYKKNILSEGLAKKYLCSLLTEELLQQKFTF